MDGELGKLTQFGSTLLPYTSQPAITSATHLFVSCAETAVQTAQLNWEMAQALSQQTKESPTVESQGGV